MIKNNYYRANTINSTFEVQIPLTPKSQKLTDILV